ncbi:hypothetical protein NHX12_031551 [Muraenolepis orangiensis]|uniref:GMP phosphodiesterase delta subunit domain-containing protein n=1 Tax=Muraenolepis orangiensis TaxID=630683 RepID=A0A9Q0E787_9TELE|nr:hypothetical protein NHX12_031551 [Muraenolepis orangiensis]
MEDEVVDAPGDSVAGALRRPSEEDQESCAEGLGEAGPAGVQDTGDPAVVSEEMVLAGATGDDPPPTEEEEEEEEDEEEEEEEEEEWNGFLSGLEGPGTEEKEERTHPEWSPGDPVTPQHVLQLKGYTEGYLCSPADNIYNINFSRFKIRELQSGAVILDIKKHSPIDIKEVVEVDPGRFIQYQFSPTFLALKEIGATLEFTVGGRAVNRLRLIERHFFRRLLLKTFDFEMGFCIPFSRNTCEHIYSLPDLDPSTIEEMVASPMETRSDSFYFANNQLIMHHKAQYSFNHLEPPRSLGQ